MMQTPPHKFIFRLAGLLSALLLLGCTNPLPSRHSEPVREYLLEWQPSSTATAPAEAPVLQVAATQSAAGFGSSDLLYIRQPHRLDRFARHRWAEAPARMLDPLLVKAAEASGLFSAVAAPGMPINADLRLDSQLLYLQQRISNGESRVELAVRVTLINVADGRQLASHTFNISEPAAANPYAGVEAANRALARLLPELTAFLADRLKAG